MRGAAAPRCRAPARCLPCFRPPSPEHKVRARGGAAADLGDEHGRSPTTAVLTRVAVEVVEPGRVDREPQPGARARLRARVDPRGEDGAVAREQRLVLGDVRQLVGVDTRGASTGRSRARRSRGPRARPPRRRAAAGMDRRSGVLEATRAGYRGRPARSASGRCWAASAIRWPPNATASPSSRASTRFIAGEPMNDGDEQVHRPRVERLRRVDLLDAAVAHDGDALPERHRLDLVVRDVDGRRTEARRAGSRARLAS